MKKIILSLSLVFICLGAFSQRSESNFEIGQKLPDILLKDVNGKDLKLSSIKNKVVLVDFWASWCRPCRMESPFLKSVYTNYANKKNKLYKGFEIYSISIDRNPEAWKKAIKDDQMNWMAQTIVSPSDPKNIAEELNIMFIPQNYLIDSKGIILAKNLRGEALEEALKKLFPNE